MVFAFACTTSNNHVFGLLMIEGLKVELFGLLKLNAHFKTLIQLRKLELDQIFIILIGELHLRNETEVIAGSEKSSQNSKKNFTSM